MTTTTLPPEQTPGQDSDPTETQEWRDALASVIEYEGTARAQFLIEAVVTHAAQLGIPVSGSKTPYCNTLTPAQEAALKLPDESHPALIQQILAVLRWNAAAIVVRAGKQAPELGGHIASYASIAVLYEIGFHYFFKAHNAEQLGDLVYFQGHSSPGIYARAFLEGHLTEDQLSHFRQEVDGKGIASYPHPWLMPSFWEFPTVSMGLGPLQAIYQARFLKYLENRGLLTGDQSQRKVWAFCGDGEMDEPESVGALTLPVRERLDNLIFVVNCNLQRLDGPVRGNGKIIEELAALFQGAGWHVIKVVWGSAWDELLAQDTTGLLLQRMAECVDGNYQSYVARGGAYFREHFFGQHPDLAALVADKSDAELEVLARARGGHDIQKVYAAYKAAAEHTGQPVVIFAKTVKGYGMGAAGEAMNVAHQQKKLSEEDLQYFCERFDISIPKEEIASAPFLPLPKDSEAYRFLQAQREALGGFVPSRPASPGPLTIPDLSVFKAQLEGSGEREISTTMAFVRLLSVLLRDKNLKERIVPIVPDETRTFGMEGLFRQIGIYSPFEQRYEPEDRKQVMYYREAMDGQLLEEGLNEAGAFCSWIAAGTSYSSNQLAMIPFYIYYSMFGFQRIGDLAWLAGDMRARGFLLGATSGRTTLSGEGLQHQDGHSHILSSMIPNCVSYDPTYAYELAVILHHGLERMYGQEEDVYFYITLMNENYQHPALSAAPGGEAAVRDGIINGMYLLESVDGEADGPRIRLLGCGTILREVIAAASMIKDDYGVSVEIWSVTSFTELRREALDVERENRLNPENAPKDSYVARCLGGEASVPVLAATDYVRLFADQVRAFVPGPYYVLGTDGFGRSDTRQKLREFFEVDAKMIAYLAVYALVEAGSLSKVTLAAAKKRYGIDGDKPNPVTV